MENDKKDTDSTTNTISLETINQVVNSAISARLRSFEKKFEEFTSKLNQQPEQPEVKKEEKVTNSELVVLKRQLENLQKERDLEVSKRKDTELRTNVKESLLKAGVAPHMIKPAMALLIDSDKTVGYDDMEQLVFRSSTGDLDLSNGISSWIKSEEGKVFVAPKGISGSGDRQFSNQPEKELTEEELGAGLVSALLGLK